MPVWLLHLSTKQTKKSAIMSNKGEKTCPLCTEEMDLTDQQLKPCKCGYEICVWCWHHIMEMAEKDDSEGRCPACRTTYNKEKIVGMAANCERVVAGINSERKQKSQKAKPKAFEGRMHLNNVRVIQRNLVYIIGLPLDLADEDLLQQREYFGQYGKVLKVSISRTATGVIQHSSNNSCCVYITYSKEEEAIRCIQSVHCFILDDRLLRACFGTTKYCHVWLRHMPCSIPDCLYLHDIGSQEDSFTKNEIVSAFTRSRVQQIIGATNNMHRRSGNVLPPPADEYINSNITSTAKPISNYSSNNKGYCADIVTGKSNAHPSVASWVMRVSATLPPNKHLSGSIKSPSNQPKTSNGPPVPMSKVVSTTRSIQTVKLMEAEASSEMHLSCKSEPLELAKEYIDGDCQIILSNINKEANLDTTATVTSKNHSRYLPSSKGSDKDIAAGPSRSSSLEHTKPFSSPGSGEDENCHTVRDFQGLCSGLSSITLGHFKREHSVPVVPNSSMSNHFSVNLLESHGSQEENGEQCEPTIFPASMGAPTMESLLDFDDPELKGLEDIYHVPSLSPAPSLLHNLKQSSYLSRRPDDVSSWSNLEAHARNESMKHEEVALPLTSKNLISNGFKSNEASGFFNLEATVESSRVFSEVGLGNYSGKHDSDAAPLYNNVASDVGESSIISKILSLDSDAWEDSLTSPHSLVKLLSVNDKQHDSLKVPSLFKESDCRQSRFSFARQEEFSNHVSNWEHSHGNIKHTTNQYSASNGWMKNKDIGVDIHQNVFSSSSSMESDVFPSSHSFISSGFAVPPPPGFSTLGTMHKPCNSSASHLLQTSTSAAGIGGIYGNGAYVDPAILEVGKGMQAAGQNNLGSDVRQTSSPQLSPFDHDARHHLLMQQSSHGYQNLRFQDHLMNSFSPPNDTYGISSMLNQSQPDNLSAFGQSTAQQFRNAPMSSGHLGSLNGVKSISDLGVSDLMTNTRVGFNKFIPTYEDLKCQMPNSSNLYHRGFAM